MPKNNPDNLRNKEIAPIGYNIISHQRSLGRQGGGIALVYKNGFNIVHKTDTCKFETMEFAEYNITLKTETINMYVMHTSHHTLDLVLMDGNDRLVSRVDRGHFLSDHCFVDMIIKAGIDPPPAKQITYRKLKNINLSNFNIDVLHEINEFGTMPLDQRVDHYNNTLKEILDRHTPEQIKH